ncbi:MAG: hypothetical protein NTV13_10145 [Actinobacteria bacterium]|nr:hypothetical protein [Actinomycetota bacterium]
MRNIYTYEVAMLINVGAQTEADAQILIREIVDEIVDNCDSPGYEFSLCNVMNENVESIFCSAEVFVPFPLQG